MERKVLILDSGTIINLAMNGLLYLIKELKENSNVSFLITKQVEYETIDRPVGVPRFELEALRVKNLLESNFLEKPKNFGISQDQINKKTKELMDIANHSIFARNKWIKLVSDAEMSCLALSSLLNEKKIENIIAIDERTTRLLAEKPSNLEKLMSKKLHFHVKIQTDKFNVFKNFKIIRSTEIVFVAHKKGLLRIKGPKALEAALFATKFKGSSVSFDEITALKKL